MNTADRSLSWIDYALRRRFSFFTLKPQFDSPRFRKHLETGGADANLIEKIVSSLTGLNQTIESETKSLGPGFAVGHSYFCQRMEEQELDEIWYESVIHNEVAPLIEEYWFDEPVKAQGLIDGLLS